MPPWTSHPRPLVVLNGDPVPSVAAYRARGGGEGLRVARSLGPWRTAEEVTLSGLRGRGGGGFRTGRKWLSVLDASRDDERRFVVANGAEGEPGTFKDRAILRHNPYQVIEGLAIAAMTVRASQAFLAVKSSFTVEVEILRRALVEMRAAGLAGQTSRSASSSARTPTCSVRRRRSSRSSRARIPSRAATRHMSTACSRQGHRWAGRLTAEAMLGVRRPTRRSSTTSRPSPPCPHILTNGAEWYRALGTWDSPGTMVFTVVGDVARPGYAELELGTTIRDVIEQVAGGPRPGRQIKAVFSGVANGVITADQLDVPATYEDLAAIGSGLGSAGLIVYDDTADMVAVARMFARFLNVESCGQCGACKLHSGAISDTLSLSSRAWQRIVTSRRSAPRCAW